MIPGAVPGEDPARDDPAVKEDTAGEVATRVMTVGSVRRLEWFARGALVLLIASGAALAWSLPRSLSYDRLFAENLALRSQIAGVDARLADLDRLMLRLRLYEAEVRSLGEPTGDHGPLPDGVWSGQASSSAPVLSDGAFSEMPMDELRPPEEWAASVSARLDTIVGGLATAEPDISQVIGELEELRALERALPGRWPARGDLTSGFGWRRSPFTRRWKFHSGLDIGARRGTSIVAVADGVVTTARYNSGYGRMVEIDHGFGITTRYAHCTALRVTKGQQVNAGDVVGTVGSTGHATGPHLHFEVRLEGHAVDPMDYLPR